MNYRLFMVCIGTLQAFHVSWMQACHEFRSKYSFQVHYFVSLPLNSAGPPEAPSSVMKAPNGISWSPSANDLNHRIIVCFEGTSNCPFRTSCTGCDFTALAGITESGNYNISVCSSNVVNGESCPSESCIFISAGTQK